MKQNLQYWICTEAWASCAAYNQKVVIGFKRPWQIILYFPTIAVCALSGKTSYTVHIERREAWPPSIALWLDAQGAGLETFWYRHLGKVESPWVKVLIVASGFQIFKRPQGLQCPLPKGSQSALPPVHAEMHHTTEVQPPLRCVSAAVNSLCPSSSFLCPV